MITTNTVFESTLKLVIETNIERIRKNLCDGGAVASMADYKYLTGQIAAFHIVIDDYFSEANQIINKR